MQVGTQVVALVSHSDGAFRKGDIYTILNISKLCCGMKIDIGLKMPENSALRCRDCATLLFSKIWWCHMKSFAPVISDNILQEALNEVMEESFII
jgi:hypothetical protein